MEVRIMASTCTYLLRLRVSQNCAQQIPNLTVPTHGVFCAEEKTIKTMLHASTTIRKEPALVSNEKNMVNLMLLKDGANALKKFVGKEFRYIFTEEELLTIKNSQNKGIVGQLMEK